MHIEKISRNLQNINSFLLRYPISIFLIVFILLFIKETKQFVYPQFWTDEGSRLFAEAWRYHWRTLLMPYDDYLHTFPRLIAAIAICFPYRWIPSIFAYTSVIIFLFAVSRILNKRCMVPYKAFFAIMIILLPSFGEVFMDLDDTQWILLVVLFSYIFYLPPMTLGEKIVDALIILLVGLTGPGIVFFYPILIWRFVEDKRTKIWLITATFACGIQFIFTHIVFHSIPTYNILTIDSRWLSAFGGRFFADFFYWQILHHAHLGALLSVIACIFPFWVGFKLVPRQYRPYAICLCYLWLIFVLAMLLRIGSYVIGPEDPSGDRYVYIPTLVTAWLLILALTNVNKKFIIALVFLILMIIQSALMFPDYFKNTDRVVDYHWAEYSQEIKPGVPMIIPINPYVNGHHWNIQLY